MDSIDELEEFLSKPKKNTHVMLDEGMILFDEASSKKTYPNIHSLFSSGRHKGFTNYIATQYPTSIPRRVRVNCADCYAFRLGDEESAKLIYKDYNRLDIDGKPAWKAILDQKKLECIHFRQPDYIKKMKL